MLWLFPNPNANQCDQLSWNYIQFIYICEISASSQRFDCNATSTNDVSHHAYLVWVTLLLTWRALCSTLCCNLSNSTQIWASPQSTLKDGNYPQAVLRRQPWGILSWYLRCQGGCGNSICVEWWYMATNTMVGNLVYNLSSLIFQVYYLNSRRSFTFADIKSLVQHPNGNKSAVSFTCSRLPFWKSVDVDRAMRPCRFNNIDVLLTHFWHTVHLTLVNSTFICCLPSPPLETLMGDWRAIVSLISYLHIPSFM